ncbi:hypothetical protein KCU64_g11644, partial [Aureobasidium melanogenum]
MSGFIRDAEQAFEGRNNNQQDSGFDNSNQGGNFDNSNQGFDSSNQGFDSNNQGGNFDNSNQGGNNNNSSSGGFGSTLKTGGEDAMLNTAANSFLTKEGVPQGADGAIDGFVDQEANKIRIPSTYGHSQLKTGHPVRSAIHKQLNGRLVLRWVTTWESLLL